ncbi:unnamed protein product [Echinostoma caproni]|uniref:Coiled-coil domain-containing protein 12 n=1 Tax=Echinostoma caproni TaxID=27848 RepID=A0A183B8D5_9TREM|nr:unnamed protein product [Echinostoma caproni]
MCTLWETVEECWDQDAEARLSAGCVTKRLTTLAQQAHVDLDFAGTPVVASRADLTCPSRDEDRTHSTPNHSEVLGPECSGPVPMTDLDLDADDVIEEGVIANKTDDNPSVGHLRDEALRRKRRLMQLRQRNARKANGTAEDSDDNHDVESEELPLPKPIFRNYKPQSENLKDGELPSAPMVDLTTLVTEQLEAATAPVVVEEVNLMNLAPRKPDWDLKRGVEKKLQKLERRTQRAIAELIRERLRETKTDLATAVSQLPGPFN